MIALEGIVDFMARSTASENKSVEIVKAAVVLLGDLGQIFGKRVINVFKQPFVSKLIQEGLGDEDVREIAGWAQTVIDIYIIFNFFVYILMLIYYFFLFVCLFFLCL